MNNKAQGLSLNTIIIAILVLLVLVFLVAMFTGVLGSFFGDVTDCEKGGGGICEELSTEYAGYSDDDKKKYGKCGLNSLGNKRTQKNAVCKYTEDVVGEAKKGDINPDEFCCDNTLGARAPDG